MITSRFFYAIILAIATGTIVFCVTFGVLRHIVAQPLQSAAGTFLLIQPGQSVAGVARDMQSRGLIRSALQFRVAAKWLGMERSLFAGEYQIHATESFSSLLRRIKAHDTYQRRIAIPEGWSVKEVEQQLYNAAGLDTTNLVMPAEGNLLPDTYFYQWGDSAASLVRRMQAAMTDTLAAEWEVRASDLPLDSPEEALVLASIVEKETAVATERPLVAAVFVNRLRRGMRLQSDPTVIYGVTGGMPLDRPISRRDLREVTAYNTYRIDGLPPTPISNPGIDSIRAVLHPAAVPYLYFVANGEGGHAFATTLENHNRNVARWRRLQRGSR